MLELTIFALFTSFQSILTLIILILGHLDQLNFLNHIDKRLKNLILDLKACKADFLNKKTNDQAFLSFLNKLDTVLLDLYIQSKIFHVQIRPVFQVSTIMIQHQIFHLCVLVFMLALGNLFSVAISILVLLMPAIVEVFVVEKTLPLVIHLGNRSKNVFKQTFSLIANITDANQLLASTSIVHTANEVEDSTIFFDQDVVSAFDPQTLHHWHRMSDTIETLFDSYVIKCFGFPVGQSKALLKVSIP